MIRQGNRDISRDQLNQLIAAFGHYKAENDSVLDNAFVRTPAFSELARRQQERSNTVLLGRKGDGKTAILIKLTSDLCAPNGEPDAKSEYVCQVDMQETFFTEMLWRFDSLASLIRERAPHIPLEQIAQKLWEQLLALTAMEFGIASVTQDASVALPTPLAELLASLNDDVVCLLGHPARLGTSDRSQRFIRFFERQLSSISLVPSDEVLAEQIDGAAHEDPCDVLRDLPPEIVEGARLLHESGVLVTLTLDRFDDFVDRFVADDIHQTRKLRRPFLHGLILAVASLEQQTAFTWLRLIASLPEDLVVDLDVREIASHKNLLNVHIRWSTRDLIAFLDQRVATVIPGATWGELFPRRVPNSNPRIQIKELCSNYLIRHTTKKPRELMAHAKALLECIRDRDEGIDSKDIPEIVARTNKRIVNDQVLFEWRSSVPYLKVFLDGLAMREPASVFSLTDLIGWSSKLPPLFSDQEITFADLPEGTQALFTLSVLFSVGVVGFRVSRSDSRTGYFRQGEGDHARYVFSYSEDAEPIYSVVGLLSSPDLARQVQSPEFVAVRAILLDGKSERLRIDLCFAPVFFERVSGNHPHTFVIDEYAA
jgi:hypothetical protein